MNDIITGRCDAAACNQPTAYITRGYLADGTSPTYNEACINHAGDVAANYLNAPSFGRSTFVRASIERCVATATVEPVDYTRGVCIHCDQDVEWFPASAGSPAVWIDRGGNTTCPYPGKGTTHEVAL